MRSISTCTYVWAGDYHIDLSLPLTDLLMTLTVRTGSRNVQRRDARGILPVNASVLGEWDDDHAHKRPLRPVTA